MIHVWYDPEYNVTFILPEDMHKELLKDKFETALYIGGYRNEFIFKR